MKPWPTFAAADPRYPAMRHAQAARHELHVAAAKFTDLGRATKITNVDARLAVARDELDAAARKFVACEAAFLGAIKRHS